MLLSILAWLLLSLLSTLFGLKILETLNIYSLGANRSEYLGELLIISAWTGILLISLILLFLSIFTPLSSSLSLFLFVVLIVFSINKLPIFFECLLQIQKLSFVLTSKWLSSLIVLALMSTTQIFLYDAGLYHVQLIKWLSEFGTVPGLALLHGRFGFTSSWFALAASFDRSIFSGRSIAIAGGFAMLLATIHFFLCLYYISLPNPKKDDYVASCFMVVALSACLPFLARQGLAFSSSPDTPIAILTIELSWLMLFIANSKSCFSRSQIVTRANEVHFIKEVDKLEQLPYVSTSNERCRDKIIGSNINLLPVILAASAFSIKLSALPLLFIALMFCFIQSFQVDRWLILKGLTISTLLIAPLMVVSFVSSGCPLFPSDFLCSNVSWSVGADEAQSMSIVIRDWARWIGHTPKDAEDLNWLIRWLQQSKETTFLIGTSLFSAVTILFFQKSSLVKGKYYLLAVGLVGVVFLLYKAPTLRFGLGSLVVLPSLGIAFAFQANSLIGSVLFLLFFWLFNVFLSSDLPPWAIGFGTVLLLVIIMTIIAIFRLPYGEENKRKHALQLFPLLLVLIGISFTGQARALYNHRNIQLILMPPYAPYPTNLERKEAVNFFYYKPEGINLEIYQCWSAPLPCTPYLDGDVVLYDANKGLRGGFRRDL